MEIERIQNRQAVYLTVLFFSSNCYALLFAAKEGAAVWVSYLFAWLIAIAVAALLGSLMRRSECSFFELLDTLLTRPVGRFFTSLLILYALLSVCTSLSIFGQFNQLTALSKTPTIILPLVIILIGAWACRSGVLAIARTASLTIWFAVFVFLLFVGLGFHNATPSLLLAFERVSLRGGMTVFCNQLGDLFLLSVLYPHLTKKATGARAITVGAVLCGGMLFVISAITVMALGGNGVIGDAYPVFTVFSIRTVGNFVQHLELLSSIAMTIFAFFRVSISFCFITQGLRHLFSLKDGRTPILPIGLILASLTQLLYHGMPMLMARLESNLSLWILIPIQILLPLALCVIARLKSLTLASK